MAPYKTGNSWSARPIRTGMSCSWITTRKQTTSTGQKWMASKLTSRFVEQARRLPFFLVAAASISLALQLQSGYTQNAREQLTLDTKTHAVQNSITDATTSPIPDKGGQVVDVKTFGAVGDGVTNDTAAFNAALASLATAGGGRCLVPKGTYLISGITNPAITSHVSSSVHPEGCRDAGGQFSVLFRGQLERGRPDD